jgi:hypothetical protein
MVLLMVAVGSVYPIMEPYEECAAAAIDDDADIGGFTASTALVRIVRCFGVKKSFRKLSVMGLPLAKIDLRILSNVHFPTSTGIPSNATRRAVC